MNIFKGLGVLGLPIAVIIGVTLLEIYRYGDCKKVGHGTLYCILNMGK